MREKEGSIKTAYEMDYGSAEDVRKHYADWAGAYDADTKTYGYVGPAEAVAMLATVLTDRMAQVLDVGCGTGLVGEALAQHGYGAIDGTDLSPEMVEVCRGKGVYRHLRCDDLMQGMDLPPGSHDAVISVGTFGPLGPDVLPNALRQVRRGGHACISVNEVFLDTHDFAAAFDALCADGGWRIDASDTRAHLLEGGHNALVTVLTRL